MVRVENIESKPLGKLYKYSVYAVLGFVAIFLAAFILWSAAGVIGLFF